MSETWFAILAADMVGSSRLMAEAEEDLVIRLADLNTSIEEIINRNDGRLFTLAGDGFKAAFPGAVEAMTAAWDIQKLARARNAGVPLSRQMLYRMGVAGGATEERQGELFGSAVTIAAGLEALASPGGVVLAKDIHDSLVTERLFKFEALGEHRLRGFKAEVTAYALVQPSRPATATVPGQAASTPATAERATTRSTSDWSELRRAGMLIVAAGVGAVALFYAFNRVVPAPASNSAPVATAAGPPAVTTQGQAIPDRMPTAPLKSLPASDPTPTAPAPPSLSDTPVAAPTGVAIATPISPPVPLAPAQTAPRAEEPGVQATPSAPVPVPAPVQAPGQVPRPPIDPLLLAHLEACFGTTSDTALSACRDLLQMNDLGPVKGREGEIQGRLGTLLREVGRHDEAVAMLETGLRAAPSAAVATQLGIAHFTRGQLADADAAFSLAIRLDARDGEAYNNRAWTRFKLGQHREAQVDAHAAQQRTPDRAYVWDTSGHIEAALGNKQAAIDAFRRAIALEPGKPTSVAGLKRLGVTP